MTLPPDLIHTVLMSPVSRLFDIRTQTFWPTYLTGLVLAAGVYLVQRPSKRASLRGLGRYLWPWRLLRRPSVLLDMKMYVFSSLYLAAQTAVILGAMGDFSAGLLRLGEDVFGPGAPDRALPLLANVIVPVLLYLAMELGYWVSHWLLHRVPALWEFHKVHHSAEVLNPLTEWRQHPVELLLVPLTIGAATAMVLAPLQWWFGPHLRLGSMWSPGLLLLIFSMTIVHLRHSHVKLDVPGWLRYVIQSPRQHHIHHSIDPAHFNRNFGFCLSVWDWVFGTLMLVSANDRIVFGLCDASGMQDELVTSISLRTHLWLPVRRLLGAKPTAAEAIMPAE